MDEWTGSEVGAESEERWAESGSESGSGLLMVERRESVESTDMT